MGLPAVVCYLNDGDYVRWRRQISTQEFEEVAKRLPLPVNARNSCH